MALPCPLSDPRLSPPDSSFRQLCPLANAYLRDKGSHCPDTERAVCVLQSPLYWAGHSRVRTWASARQHHGGRRSQAADPRVLPGGMGALVPGRLAVSLPVVCLVKALGDSGLKQEKGRVLGILRGRQGPLLTRCSPFSPRDPQPLRAPYLTCTYTGGHPNHDLAAERGCFDLYVTLM